MPVPTHPEYDARITNWNKYRLLLDSGRDFIEEYLKPFSIREDSVDFATRKEITYCPSHARTALIEIRNAIFQRMRDIQRIGGGPTYALAVEKNINLNGKSMNHFLGATVLEELLAMGRVGIFIDRPPITGLQTLKTPKRSPYLYYYTAENIKNWSYDNPDNPDELTAVLLRDEKYERDPETGLPVRVTEEYRQLQTTSSGVLVTFFDDEMTATGELLLNLPRIPMLMLRLSQSILTDIADYQIALLNMESSDVNYALKANYPFYTEQYDPRAMNPFTRTAQDRDSDGNTVEPGTENASGNAKVKVGATKGRRYPLGTERPGFVNPSPDPLRVSMEKQELIKRDIRTLASLAVAGLSPMRASADSKNADLRGLEEGLSYIGMELEYAENQIAAIWSLYTNEPQATVKYPLNYSLMTEEDRFNRAETLRALAPVVPSQSYQREVMKMIAKTLLGSKVSDLTTIYAEIDTNPVTIQDPEVIYKHIEQSLLSAETASKAVGYPVDEFTRATQEHAERAARVVQAQMAAKEANKDEGTGSARDLQDDPNRQYKDEKTSSQTATTDPDAKEGKRGANNQG